MFEVSVPPPVRPFPAVTDLVQLDAVVALVALLALSADAALGTLPRAVGSTVSPLGSFFLRPPPALILMPIPEALVVRGSPSLINTRSVLSLTS